VIIKPFTLILIVLFITSTISCYDIKDAKGTLLKTQQSRDFSVYDHSGRHVDSTSFDSVSILTFLFSNCTNVCPIVVSNIKQSLNTNSKYEKIPVIIISVDPEHDSDESVQKYMDKWELDNNWYYITGSESTLQTIWKDYYINPQAIRGQKSITQALKMRNKIAHTSPVFILNREGAAVLVHTNPINPESLYHDIDLIAKISD
jgi:protein SCO1/2